MTDDYNNNRYPSSRYGNSRYSSSRENSSNRNGASGGGAYVRPQARRSGTMPFEEEAPKNPAPRGRSVNQPYNREPEQRRAYSRVDRVSSREPIEENPRYARESRSTALSTRGGESSRAYSRSASASRASQTRQKRNRFKLIGAVLASVLAVSLLGTVAFAVNYVTKIGNSLHEGLDENVASALKATQDVQSLEPTVSVPEVDISGYDTERGDAFYMLLVGVDKAAWREEEDMYGGAYRTDSVILARIDPQLQVITLISLHRDILMDLSYLGGSGQDKLNSAYLYAGQAGIIDVASNLAGVPISHYAEIDFDGFIGIVDDCLGGVYVDVEMDFYDPYLECEFTAGWQLLDGDQALDYSRARHAFDDIGDGDVYRAKHQRQVISAILKQVLACDVATLLDAVQFMAGYVTTDLTLTDIGSLALQFRGLNTDNNIYSGMTPTYGEVVDGTWYEVIMQDEWANMMARVNLGLTPTDSAESASASNVGSTATTIAVKNGSYIEGAHDLATIRIREAGYVVGISGMADSQDYPETIVIYDLDEKYWDAETVAQSLGCAYAMKNPGDYSFPEDLLVIIGNNFV